MPPLDAVVCFADNLNCITNAEVQNYTHYQNNNTVFQVTDTAQDFNRTGFATLGSGNAIEFSNATSYFDSGRWIWKQPDNTANLVDSTVAFNAYKWDLNNGSAYFSNSSVSW